MDASGNLYIADSNNFRIRKVSGGIINTIAETGTGGYVASHDGGPAACAQVNWHQGLWLDASGNLYIADYSNGRIRVIYH